MTIAEMHVWFRQYAQQMGMQNVRAILPEQIDLVINTSITDTVNQIITQNIGLTNDRIITDNSKIGQINALRSLYKVEEINAAASDSPTKGKPFKKGNESHILRLSGSFDNFKAGEFNYLYIVDLAINYKHSGDKLTNYFPVRLIDDAYLADTLNDFILKPRLRTPVAVIYNNQLDLYIDELTNSSLPQGLTPNSLRFSYIAKPQKVAYLADINGTNVDCDLPDYMHVDILKHAVDLYNTSIQGGMYAAQQQQQAQNREMSRNVARPNNEGYQS